MDATLVPSLSSLSLVFLLPPLSLPCIFKRRARRGVLFRPRRRAALSGPSPPTPPVSVLLHLDTGASSWFFASLACFALSRQIRGVATSVPPPSSSSSSSSSSPKQHPLFGITVQSSAVCVCVCVEKPHQPSFESQSSKTPPAPTTMCTAAAPPAVVSCLVHLFLRLQVCHWNHYCANNAPVLCSHQCGCRGLYLERQNNTRPARYAARRVEMSLL